MRHSSQENVSGSIRFGFGDPEVTRLPYGLFQAIIPLLSDRCQFNFFPFFWSGIYRRGIDTRYHYQTSLSGSVHWNFAGIAYCAIKTGYFSSRTVGVRICQKNYFLYSQIHEQNHLSTDKTIFLEICIWINNFSCTTCPCYIHRRTICGTDFFYLNFFSL